MTERGSLVRNTVYSEQKRIAFLQQDMKKLQCADLYHDPLEEDSGSRSHVYFATEPFMEGVSEPRPHELTLGWEHLRTLLLLLLHWVSLR